VKNKIILIFALLVLPNVAAAMAEALPETVSEILKKELSLEEYNYQFEVEMDGDLESYATSIETLRGHKPVVLYKDIFEQEKKRTTFLLYIAADNNLFLFVSRALAGLQQIGSNRNINILVHLNIRAPNKPKVTKKLYIGKNKIIQIGPDECLDSGSIDTLKAAEKWAIEDFPSDIFIIDFWNHGGGDLSPKTSRIFDPSKMFRFNPQTNKIEVDRSMTFTDFIYWENSKTRVSVCFDETTSAYLDDEKLMEAFEYAKKLRKKPIDIVIYDACFMAGIGTAHVSRSATYLCASSEVELGPGYDYEKALKILLNKNASVEEIAKYIVQAYKETYAGITNDYTHSAMKLEYLDAVEKNLDTVSMLLIESLQQQKKKLVKNIIKKSRQNTICFEEPSYIDMYDFFLNLEKEIDRIKLKNQRQNVPTITRIKEEIKKLLNSIDKLIIINVVGKGLKKARGITFYFPRYQMNGRYYKSFDATAFGKISKWKDFLEYYLTH